MCEPLRPVSQFPFPTHHCLKVLTNFKERELRLQIQRGRNTRQGHSAGPGWDRSPVSWQPAWAHHRVPVTAVTGQTGNRILCGESTEESLSMWAAVPGVEHPIRQGQICSFLVFPSVRDKHWDTRFKETGQSKREAREPGRETKK